MIEIHKSKTWINIKPEANPLDKQSSSSKTAVEEALSNKLISVLEALLQENDSFRPMQKKALFETINLLERWIRVWLIKLPTWVWKTYLFWKILKAVWWLNVVLVPNIPLIWNTYDEFVWNEEKKWVWFSSDEVFFISSEESWNLGSQVEEILKKSSWVENWVILMTYSGLNVLWSTNSNFLKEIFKRSNIIISDEWHRSIWDKTQTHFSTIFDKEEWDIDIAEDSISDYIKQKIHLYFTATPWLSQKSVEQYATPFFMWKISDSIADWTNILPTARLLGHAYAYSSNPLTDTTKDFENYRYFDEYWENLDDVLLDEYEAEKEAQNWYLPWIYACRDIEHAEKVTKLAKSKWIKAVRVTSWNTKIKRWMDARDAKKWIENRDIDLVVTVRQVAEWWDVRTLRAYVQWCPIMSPAKATQLLGRIMRSLSKDDLKKYPEKNTSNTFYIAPRSRDVVVAPSESNSNSRSDSKTTNTITTKPTDDSLNKARKIWWIANTFETLNELGELLLSQLSDSWFTPEKSSVKLISETNEGEIDINWKTYQVLSSKYDENIKNLTWRNLQEILDEWLFQVSDKLIMWEDHFGERYQLCPLDDLIDKYSIKEMRKVDFIKDSFFEYRWEKYFVFSDFSQDDFVQHFPKDSVNRFLNHIKYRLYDKKIFYVSSIWKKVVAIKFSNIDEILNRKKVQELDIQITEDWIIEFEGEKWQIHDKKYEYEMGKRYKTRLPVFYCLNKNLKLKTFKDSTKVVNIAWKKYRIIKLSEIARIFIEKE